jgi:hypothetical protein
MCPSCYKTDDDAIWEYAMTNDEVQTENELAAYKALVAILPQESINQAYMMVKTMGIPWTMQFFDGLLPQEVGNIVEMAFKQMERLQQWDA